MKTFEALSDAQWAQLEPLFPKLIKRSRGKPHTPWRSVVNSIFLFLFTKIKWSAIPSNPSFATKSAAHRWFLLWEKNGFLNELIEILGTSLEAKPEVSLPPRRQRQQITKINTQIEPTQTETTHSFATT
jgi:transposase